MLKFWQTSSNRDVHEQQIDCRRGSWKNIKCLFTASDSVNISRQLSTNLSQMNHQTEKFLIAMMENHIYLFVGVCEFKGIFFQFSLSHSLPHLAVIVHGLPKFSDEGSSFRYCFHHPHITNSTREFVSGVSIADNFVKLLLCPSFWTWKIFLNIDTKTNMKIEKKILAKIAEDEEKTVKILPSSSRNVQIKIVSRLYNLIRSCWVESSLENTHQNGEWRFKDFP